MFEPEQMEQSSWMNETDSRYFADFEWNESTQRRFHLLGQSMRHWNSKKSMEWCKKKRKKRLQFIQIEIVSSSSLFIPLFLSCGIRCNDRYGVSVGATERKHCTDENYRSFSFTWSDFLFSFRRSVLVQIQLNFVFVRVCGFSSVRTSSVLRQRRVIFMSYLDENWRNVAKTKAINLTEFRANNFFVCFSFRTKRFSFVSRKSSKNFVYCFDQFSVLWKRFSSEQVRLLEDVLLFVAKKKTRNLSNVDEKDHLRQTLVMSNFEIDFCRFSAFRFRPFLSLFFASFSLCVCAEEAIVQIVVHWN